MKVRFAPEIVADDAVSSLLDDILRFFETGRHRWIIDDIEGIERSKWVEQAGERQSQRILDLLRKTVTEGAYGESPRGIEIEIGPGDDHVAPSLAWDTLNKPAYIVVEDEASDGCFLRALAHAYEFDSLDTALDNEWLKIRHGGGKDGIHTRVRSLIRERAANPRRIQALADSDRLRPDDESTTVRKMRELEQEHAITVHVLHKREAENYLPLDAIAHVRQANKQFRKTYAAFCRMRPEQQDHFDMKLGFKRNADGVGEIPPKQATLFADLRRSTIEDLVGGFGKSCAHWFESEGKVPHYITRATLEARCATKPGELPAILAKIEEML